MIPCLAHCTHMLASIVECPMSLRPLSKQQFSQKGWFKTFEETRVEYFIKALISRNTYCPDEFVLPVFVVCLKKKKKLRKNIEEDKMINNWKKIEEKLKKKWRKIEEELMKKNLKSADLFFTLKNISLW